MTTLSHPAGSRRPRDTHSLRAAVPASTLRSKSVTRTNQHKRGGTVLFEIDFTSAMTGSDLELLRRQLDMTTQVEHKLPAYPNTPAVARLDHSSGLFLERADGESQWLLQARTWGNPPAPTIHEWRVRTAQVVRQLDPETALPERVPSTQPEIPQRLVGRAGNRRPAWVRRWFAGMS
jgi:hypothetical protein